MSVIADNRVLFKSVLFNMSGIAAVVVLFSVLTSAFIDRDYGISILLWTMPGIIILTLIYILNLGLIRGESQKELKNSLGISNLLSSVRIVASIPILVSFLKGYSTAAFVIYAAAAITDVLDGFIARRYSQTTVLGIIIDPVGDVFTTETVFLCLWRAGVVPGWLFAVLSARYLEFFLGWILIAVAGKQPPLSSTMAGKIVGVIQFTGVMLLVSEIIFRPFDLYGLTRDIILYALGMSFLAVMISQTLIGFRAFRNGEYDTSAAEGE